MSYYVDAILVDKRGKTIGARLITENKKVIDVTSAELTGCTKKFVNAILDKRGYLRSKAGYEPLKKVTKIVLPSAVEQKDLIDSKKLLSNNIITVYHGSKELGLKPKYGYGAKNNDYGIGFYTTPNKELAKEWAWSAYTHSDKAYVYSYTIDISSLRVLNLTEYDSVHWIAELLYNRKINNKFNVEFTALQDTITAFIDKYKLNTENYDLIVGYRADDSYFSYAEAFVQGYLYKEVLDKALRYGNLGLQVFVKSKRAFNILKQLGEPEEVPQSYKVKYRNRDKNARETYNKTKNEKGKTRIFDYL